MPPKVSFFALEASSRKIVTLDNLKRRGGHSANRWFLCFEDQETKAKSL